MIEQAKCFYSTLGKYFEKQIKINENQGEKKIKAIKEHGKQLVKSNAFVKNVYHLASKNKESISLLRKEWMQ